MSVLIDRVERHIRTSAERSFAEMPKVSLPDHTLRDICKIGALEWALRDLLLVFNRDDPKRALENLLAYWDEKSEDWEEEQRVRYETDECASALLEEALP